MTDGEEVERWKPDRRSQGCRLRRLNIPVRDYLGSALGGEGSRTPVLDRLDEELSGERVVRHTSFREYLDDWFNGKKAETAPSTMTFYRGSLTKFLEFLGKRSDDPMAEVAKQDIVAFRNSLTTQVSAKTVNHDLKALKMVFKSARRDGVVTEDPTEFVETVRRERVLEKKLKAAALPMSSAQALEAPRTMHVVDIRVGAEIRRGVTAGNHQARQTLAALAINNREPLQPESHKSPGVGLLGPTELRMISEIMSESAGV